MKVEQSKADQLFWTQLRTDNLWNNLGIYMALVRSVTDPRGFSSTVIGIIILRISQVYHIRYVDKLTNTGGYLYILFYLITIMYENGTIKTFLIV